MAGINTSGVTPEDNAAHNEGRDFRTFMEHNFASSGDKVCYKFSSPVGFRLISQTLVVHNGDAKVDIYVSPTPAGTFNIPAPIFGKNRLLNRPRPYYVGQVTINYGGTITGGTRVEPLRLKAPTATGQTSTVVAGTSSYRSLPAGDYYIQITAGANSTECIFYLEYVEMP